MPSKSQSANASRGSILVSSLRWLTMAASLLAIMGCAGFKPGRVSDAEFLSRALHREHGPFRVTVAVPNRAEAQQLFDRKLYREGIQPVWIRVENRSTEDVYFLPSLVDADYFAPLEAAYQYHSIWRPGRNRALDGFFRTNSMRVHVPAGAERSGFVYTHLDLGIKHICVGLADQDGAWQDRLFTFGVEVPGLKTDWPQRSLRDLTNSMPRIECDESRLRAELESLPRATTGKNGEKEGDPLNLVIIGGPGDLVAMIGCGWDETERLTSGTAWHTLRSFLFGAEYRYSPVSSLYYAGRRQDFALQKARGSINLRNHLRLWLTPFNFHGKPVWLGQISRDIGVRWTLKTANFTTHKIDPNVDEARTYLIQDLIRSQVVTWWGYVKGVGPISFEAPRHNLTGDPYYTDGLRAVIELSTEPVDPDKVSYKPWETPP